MDRILELLKENRTYSIEELTKIIDIDKTILIAELDYLENKNFIKKTYFTQERKCNNCYINCRSSNSKLKYFWELV